MDGCVGLSSLIELYQHDGAENVISFADEQSQTKHIKGIEQNAMQRSISS